MRNRNGKFKIENTKQKKKMKHELKSPSTMLAIVFAVSVNAAAVIRGI